MDNNLIPAQDDEDTYKQGCNLYDNTASNDNMREADRYTVRVSNTFGECLFSMFGGMQGLLSPRSDSSLCVTF